MSVASLNRWRAAEALRRVRSGLVLRGFVRPKIVSRFNRDKDGTAALEFAFVAGPFLFLLFAIIEVAMVFFAGQVLETATANASRLIMTGQAKTQNFDQAAFKNAVCQRTDVLMSCAGIAVDVRTYASFGAASTALWLGWSQLLEYALYSSLLGGLLTLGLLSLRGAPFHPPLLMREGWYARITDAKTGIPYGIALAAAGLILYPSSFWMTGALH